MNIGIFTDTYHPSINGVVTSIDSFRKEFEALGHKVYVFCPGIIGFLKKKTQKTGQDNIIRFFSLPYPFLPEYRIALPFPMKLKLIRRLKLDIIHFNTPFLMGLFAIYLGKRFRIPLIQTYHTYLAEYAHYVPFIPKHTIIRFAVKVTQKHCNSAAFVISPSRLIRDVLLGYGVKTDVVIIPTGISGTADIIRDSLELKKTYGIPDQKNILITVGRLAKEKNFSFLIRAFRIIEEQVPDTCLVLIGDGPERYNLAELGKKLGIRQKIRFLGYIKRNEVLKILSVSNIFVFASRTETQGLCLLEAMSAGKPVVAIKAMGVMDIMEGDRGGFLVDADEKAFAERVISLLTDKSLYSRKVNEADMLAEQFSSKNQTQKLLGYYEKAIAINREKQKVRG